MNLFSARLCHIRRLSNPPEPFPVPYGQSEPMYHWNNGNFVNILVTQQHAGIYKYDLDKQIITEKYNAPFHDTLPSDSYGALDLQKGIIYIVFNYHLWIAFNVRTMGWHRNLYVDDELHFAHSKFFITNK